MISKQSRPISESHGEATRKTKRPSRVQRREKPLACLVRQWQQVKFRVCALRRPGPPSELSLKIRETLADVYADVFIGSNQGGFRRPIGAASLCRYFSLSPRVSNAPMSNPPN